MEEAVPGAFRGQEREFVGTWSRREAICGEF